ncbi:ATP-binding protein [Actinomadura kijaniata]|uniref:ATP-binding protein n=1 Tax=Actinomadura kijaniata TaxID=46161 RepID=UPI000836F311|nr:ATP-binding protein [Actinomadura kijaniata]
MFTTGVWWTVPLTVSGLAVLSRTLWPLHKRHQRDHTELMQARRRHHDDTCTIEGLSQEADRQQQAWAGRLEELEAEQTAAQERADAALQLLRRVLAEQIPAAARGGPIPMPTGVDSELLGQTQALIRQGLDCVAAVRRHAQAQAQAAADQMESQQLVMVVVARRLQAAMHRVQHLAAQTAEARRGLPDVVEAMMEIDHAASQGARSCQSVAVVSGSWEGQHWSAPIRLAELVQSAQARIEDYRRVSTTGDPDLAIVGPAAEPLIHMVAEVLANAAQCSPVRTQVRVKVSAGATGAVIEVDDEGVGVQETRRVHLQALASGAVRRELADLGEVPQLGLSVVGRYASALGVRITLEDSPYGGLRVIMLIPGELTEPVAPRVMALSPPSPSSSARGPIAGSALVLPNEVVPEMVTATTPVTDQSGARLTLPPPPQVNGVQFNAPPTAPPTAPPPAPSPASSAAPSLASSPVPSAEQPAPLTDTPHSSNSGPFDQQPPAPRLPQRVPRHRRHLRPDLGPAGEAHAVPDADADVDAGAVPVGPPAQTPEQAGQILHALGSLSGPASPSAPLSHDPLPHEAAFPQPTQEKEQ